LYRYSAGGGHLTAAAWEGISVAGSVCGAAAATHSRAQALAPAGAGAGGGTLLAARPSSPYTVLMPPPSMAGDSAGLYKLYAVAPIAPESTRSQHLRLNCDINTCA
jgi:hypothetical protein